ncbi:MAG: phosphoglycolate phosphatase [Alphaproteobacteria bacterium]
MITPAYRFKAVVFDLDGTLIDSAPDVRAAVNKVLAELGRPALGLREIRGLVGDGARILMQRCLAETGPQPTDAEVDAAVTRYLDFYRTDPAGHTEIYPYVVETLMQLSAEGLKLGVCTNKPHEMTMLVLRALGIAKLFKAILGADLMPFKKPDPRHVLRLLEMMDARPADAVLVGDSEVDMESARNVGIPAVAVTYGYSRGNSRDLDAEVRIGSFRQLPDALMGLGAVIAPATLP